MHNYIYRWKCAKCGGINESPAKQCSPICLLPNCRTWHAYTSDQCIVCDIKVRCLSRPSIIYICFGYYMQRRAWEVGPNTYIPEFVNCDNNHGQMVEEYYINSLRKRWMED
jgi:hypothetical protein